MWTKEQQLAIDIRRQNTIVSAGAGSGKTAVLTERAFQILEKKEANIDELLILTFTNAAAHEMKDRIRKKLKDAKLFELADQVEASNITTFDAFALSLVKKMHLFLNVSPNVSILDEAIIRVERRKIIDELFEHHYKIKHEEFLKMIYSFCPKYDDSLKGYVESILDASYLTLNQTAFLNDFIKNSVTDAKLNEMIKEVEALILQRFLESEEMLGLMEDHLYADKVIPLIQNIVNAPTYDDMFDLIQSFKFPRGTLSEDDKELREQVKKYIKGLSEKIALLGNSEEIRLRFFNRTTLDSLGILLEIAKETESRLNHFKRTHNAFSFQDIAKMALEIVLNKELSESTKSKIKYIMIDEYQDTSDIQDAIINAIGDNNIFMVGDTKQSIYRFRNANCAIFQGKYDAYKKNQGGTKIDLNKNFRSRKEVIEDLNMMFSSLMSDKIGGVNYRLDHIIEHGNMSFENEGATSQNQNIEVLNYKNETLYIKNEQYEAQIIAQDIIKKIKEKYLVFDKDKKMNVACTFKDFAILIDRKSSFEEFSVVFNQFGIPLKIYKEELIATTQVGAVINSLVNFLICLKEKRFGAEFKHAFVSLARSYLFSLNDQEIYDIMQNNAVFDSEIYIKIARLDQESKNFSLSSKLTYLVDELNMYSKLILIGNVENNMQNIDSLIETTKMIESLGYSLSDFYQYLKSLKKLKINLANSDESEVDNVVKVMSIHKSKGLEFNIIYFPMLHKQFSGMDNKKTFLISNTYGSAMPVIEEATDNRISIQSLLIKEKERQDNLSERIRLFYVALTRTKEKMIILMDQSKRKSINTLNTAESFSNLLCYLNVKGIEFNEATCALNEKIKSTKQDCDYGDIPSVIIKQTPKEIFALPSVSRARKEAILVPEDYLKFGNELHYLMELVDLRTKDVSFIKNPAQKKMIEKILELEVFNVSKCISIYKEYSFSDEVNNVRGIIDLMLEEQDQIIIIDYKTKNLNKEEYVDQLKTYEKYISRVFNKKTSLFLVSFIDKTSLKID